jgi:release factor glutamine methyltransferase
MFAEMTIQEASQYCIEQLNKIYDKGEAIAITGMVMEEITGLRITDSHFKKEKSLTPDQASLFNKILERLLTHEPVQYVLNESWFCGFKFYVDKNVLIPRPETEELVEWIITYCNTYLSTQQQGIRVLKILDIGSGSGCIPVTLKRKLQKSEIWGCDISIDALKVAKKNATDLATDINFIRLDFLDKEQWKQLPEFDIIISNPPYVPAKEAAQMRPNVLKYEPSIALFVPDDDALIFYKAIAEFGKKHLKKGGNIFLEIHESLGEAVLKMLKENGYTAEIRKDMQQKDRMIKAGLLLIE